MIFIVNSSRKIAFNFKLRENFRAVKIWGLNFEDRLILVLPIDISFSFHFLYLMHIGIIIYQDLDILKPNLKVVFRRALQGKKRCFLCYLRKLSTCRIPVPIAAPIYVSLLSGNPMLALLATVPFFPFFRINLERHAFNY